MRQLLSIILTLLLPTSQGIGGKAGVGGTAGIGGGVLPPPTFTEIQGKWGTQQGSGTTVNVTLTSAPTAGNAVICAVEIYPNTLTISSIVDNAGSPNSYTVTPNSPSKVQAAAVQIFFAYLLNVPASAGATITVTASGSITFASYLGCEEFHRSSGTWTFDTDITGNGAPSTAVNAPSITPAAAGELLYAVVTTEGSVAVTSANSPWTAGGAGTNTYSRAEYILSGASGATATDFTLASITSWNSMGMALK